ncbi:MAG TPA: beta-galactosidase GalB [Oceanipulchritudo sp.]|nr:beta-galactosidase GalB [Oceanipulchritudo sp.]
MKKLIIYLLGVGMLFGISNTCIAERSSFNSGWRFLKGVAEGAEQPGYDDSEWRALTLPHDWAIEGPFSPEYNARTGGLPVHGTGWYRKHFEFPGSAEGKRVSLDFDGAMANATVWLNGQLVGHRPNGYVGFRVDLTPHLEPGAENVVAVRLTPEDFSSRWYPGAGLYRNTWLEVDHPVHVAQWGTFITTPEVSTASARVNIQTEIENASAKSKPVRLRTTLLGPAGRELAVLEDTVRAAAGKTTVLDQSTTLKNPRLWDLETPHLHAAVSEIIENDRVVDRFTTSFGIRRIEYGADFGLKLNGRQVRMNGVCLHHDLGPLGAAVNARATERQLEIMQAMGANAIRTSHNPPSPEQVYACDRMGILVQLEAFDAWALPKVKNDYSQYFEEWHERDLRDTIRSFRNNPSVVMWSIGNEMKEQYVSRGGETARELAAICREEDPTRPVTAGFNSHRPAIRNGLAAAVDLVGYNYKPRKYRETRNEHPDWIVYGSETSSTVSSRGVYHLPMEKYKTHESLQVTSYDFIGPPWAYPPDLEFEAVNKGDNLLGEFVWTGFDYLGEPTPYGGRDNSTDGYWNGHWPARSSYFGIVDLCGFPKDRYYLYQSEWSATPMVHLLPHWNWEGMEGEPIPVFAYTTAEEVELFVNGVSQGTQVKGVDKTPLPLDFMDWEGGRFKEVYQSPYRLSWVVPYEAGEIKVVARQDGRIVAEKRIVTAGEPARLELLPDRTTIHANGVDLSFVTVRILDRDGNFCPLADNRVEFVIEGEGAIAAVGNGNPATTEPFQSDHRKAFNGLCMLIIQSGRQPGNIKITATAEGLEANSVNVTVE